MKVYFFEGVVLFSPAEGFGISIGKSKIVHVSVARVCIFQHKLLSNEKA